MDELTWRHLQVPPDHYDRGIKNNFFQKLWHKSRFAEVTKILDDTKPKRILDIGCHGGTFTEVIGNKFPEAQVFGIDISAPAVAYAQKNRPKIHFQVAKAEELPFFDRFFNLITCFDTFEHLPDSQRALSEMKRVLAKDGEVLFLIPTESFLFKTVWFFWSRFGPGKVWQETHIQNFNGTRLDKLLEKSGFKVQVRKTINLGMLLLIKARKQE